MRSRNKVLNNHFVEKHSQLTNSRMQMFFKIGVLKNFTQVFSRECYKIFKSSAFIENLRWLLFQFDKVSVQYWASVDFLFLIKNTMWDGFY